MLIQLGYKLKVALCQASDEEFVVRTKVLTKNLFIHPFKLDKLVDATKISFKHFLIDLLDFFKC